MDIGVREGTGRGVLVCAVAWLAAALMLQGCHTGTTGGGPPVGDATDVARQTGSAQRGVGGQSDQQSVRLRMGGGQPIMPSSKGFAKPGDRLTVTAVIADPKDETTFVKVTPIVKVEGGPAIPFDMIGKIEYLGEPYNDTTGMKIPAYAQGFSFDIVLLGDSGMQPQPPDVVSCILEMTINTSPIKNYLGFVVDLPEKRPQ